MSATLLCFVCNTRLDPLLKEAGVHLLCEPVGEPVDDTVDDHVTELFTIISDAITNQPRSLQTRIGPSEIGIPCNRRIGYKLAGTPESNKRGVAFKPWIGTQAHEGMAMIMTNASLATEDARWIVEGKVTVGEVDGVPITGSADLFDKRAGIVFDWKFTTKNKIRETYRPHGPGDQYRIQAHLYGRGFAAKGHDVKHVAIIFMTRDGDFADRYVWSEPYDEQIALDALARVDGIAAALRLMGPEKAIPALPMAESHCTFCPYFKANSTNPVVACPGIDKPTKPSPLLSLIA